MKLRNKEREFIEMVKIEDNYAKAKRILSKYDRELWL